MQLRYFYSVLALVTSSALLAADPVPISQPISPSVSQPVVAAPQPPEQPLQLAVPQAPQPTPLQLQAPEQLPPPSLLQQPAQSQLQLQQPSPQSQQALPPAEPTALKQLRELQRQKDERDKQARQQQKQPQQVPVPVPVAPAPHPQHSGLIHNQMQQNLDQVRRAQQQQEQVQQSLNEDPEVAELEAMQKKYREQVGALNLVNPMATDTGTGAGSRLVQEKVEWQSLGSIQRDWMAKPWFKQFVVAMMESTRNPEYMKAVGELLRNPNLRWMVVGLGLWSIICWLLKRRVLAATDRFFPRLMVSLGMFVVFMVGYFLVSYALLGPPVQTVLGVFAPAIYTAGKAALLGTAH